MGNSNNNSQQGPTFGGIAIQTDKPYYFAGDMVTGHIHIDVIHPNYPGHTLVLKIKGFEHSYWVTHHHKTVGRGKRRTRQSYAVKHEGSALIYSNKVPIHSFGQMSVQQGQYTFPFQFQLRPDIPGSIQIIGPEFSGKILYMISAKVPRTKKSVTTLKGKQFLNVREVFREQVQSLENEATRQIEECGCINQGVTFFKVFAEKNVFIAGQQCFVRVVIDNSRCSTAVNMINVDLINIMVLRTESGQAQSILRSISKKSHTGVSGKQGGENSFTFQLPIIDQSNAILGGTTHGRLVNNSYLIRVSLEMDVSCGCCTPDPSIDLPITVVTEIPPLPMIAQPQNWQPQVIETQPIQFDQSNQYQPVNQQPMNYLNQNIMQQNQGMDDQNRVYPIQSSYPTQTSQFPSQSQQFPSQFQQQPQQYNYPPQSQFQSSQQYGYQQPINYPYQQQPYNQGYSQQNNNNDPNPFN